MKRLFFLTFIIALTFASPGFTKEEYLRLDDYILPPPPVNVDGAISTHNADTTAVHGITDTSKITTNAAVITDNAVVRGDGGANGVQSSAMSIGDNGKVTATATLNNATGDETAYYFPYTVNKSDSGNDYGLYVNMTDTASPGLSEILWAGVGGSYVFKVNNAGNAFVSNSFSAGGNIQTLTVRSGGDNNTLSVQTRNFTVADNAVEMINSTFSNTSGTSAAVAIIPTYNQTSGTAANTDLLINRTQTAVGSGAQNLIDAQVGGTSKFKVSNTGAATFAGFTADPCGSLSEGAMFYNSTSHYFCYCDGTNDVKLHDPAAACF